MRTKSGKQVLKIFEDLEIRYKSLFESELPTQFIREHLTETVALRQRETIVETFQDETTETLINCLAFMIAKEQTQIETKPKRKRGRPRKHPKPE